MKIYFLALVFLASFALACDGCEYNGVCSDYGEQIAIGQATYFCDYASNSFVQTKTNGECQNDFECTDGYLCLNEECTNAYTNYLESLEFIDMNIDLNNLNSYCIGADYFCDNTTTVYAHSTASSKNCSFLGNSFHCHKCDSGFSWNESLQRCVTGICSATPGCLDISSLANASSSENYCAIGKCFSCDSDFDWNGTKCVLKNCSSSPGCLDEINISNGHTRNRYCATGKCFVCNSGYSWNSVSDSCVVNVHSGGAIDWEDVDFSESEFISGSSKLLGVDERISFSFEGREYWFEVLSVSTSSWQVRFNLNPIANSRVITMGNTQKFDLNSDGYYEVSVTLNAIANGLADVSVKRISELYNINAVSPPNNSSEGNNIIVDSTSTEVGDKANSYKYLFIIGGSICVLLAIIILVFVILSSRRNTVEQNVPVSSPVSSSAPGGVN